MSFFIRNSRGRATTKRKHNNHTRKGGENSLGWKSTKKLKSVPHDNESIGSTDEELAEENERGRAAALDSDIEGEEEETAQEKRLRIAKKHLQEIEEKERDRAEFEQGAISRRLHEEYLEEKGHLKKTVASNYTGFQEFILLKCKHQKDSITCLCVSSNGLNLYSGSKDGTLVKWSLSEKVKLKVVKGKRKKQDGIKNVQCIAISTDNKFLVVGDRGCNGIRVLCGNTLDFIKMLQGHRDAVTGLVFRKNTHTLYSASEDRSVKVWNLDDMAYVETLFGHQTGITSIDALTRERAITSGGFDKSIRIWKIVEESQLIFNGHGGSIDSVKLINEESFFSCGDDGRLCVWGCLKKVPLCTVFNAHGKDEFNGEPIWISSIATLLNTDLVASGSRNGVIKLWRCGHSFKSLDPLFEIQLVGFINALVFTPDGNNLIAGVGQEHRLGRWWRISEAKNSVVIIPLVRNQTEK